MDSNLELTPEEMSEVIQKDTHKWDVCNPEFVMDVASVIAKAQVNKVLSMLEPVELEVLGDEELQRFAVGCVDYPKDLEGEYDWTKPRFTKGHIEKVYRDISQATIQHNQKGQLYRIKE